MFSLIKKVLNLVLMSSNLGNNIIKNITRNFIKILPKHFMKNNQIVCLTKSRMCCTKSNY